MRLARYFNILGDDIASGYIYWLVLPEILEPLRRKFCVPNRMLNVLMAHVVLNCPGILAIIG